MHDIPELASLAPLRSLMLIRILSLGSEVQNMYAQSTRRHISGTQAGSRGRIPCFPVAKIAAVGH